MTGREQILEHLAGLVPASATFILRRQVDVTGVSGTGVVADGVVFPSGTCVINWRGERPSTVVWPDVRTALDVHGHDGKTRFEFVHTSDLIAALRAAVDEDPEVVVSAVLSALQLGEVDES